VATSEDLVRSLLVEQLGVDPAAVTLNSRLVEDLEVSSPDMISIIQQIEELANLTIPDAVFQSFMAVLTS
jgi:acyl carrier protein